ncbi:hypothetical protein JHK82_016229 [Glycine max]|nr:hypothetical protein JHK85_016633 [Glycine max]KAG5046856.1 hypothetical protein JHK86_016262 [Glycine max]KAG5149348.1 hypothetical protein JHK82_016229 [Glycine max]
MDLYVVVEQSTQLVVLGKVHDNSSTIHNVPYVDDAVRDSQKCLPKLVKSAEMDNVVVADDPLGELVKNLFDIDQKSIELSWDGAKFGLPNVKDGFLITHADMFFVFMAHWQLVVLCPRDNIVVWFFSLRKKSDVNIKTAVNSAMKTLTTTLEGKPDQAVSRWIKSKSHVQTGGYECRYYVMHWMWCIVSGGLKNEWNRVCLL